MEADLGGTDILPPLRDIFRQETDPAFPRQIFVLTDGEVNDTRAVINTVRDSALATRVFTLGIGDEASRPLVQVCSWGWKGGVGCHGRSTAVGWAGLGWVGFYFIFNPVA